jgi:hypothetical protein
MVSNSLKGTYAKVCSCNEIEIESNICNLVYSVLVTIVYNVRFREIRVSLIFLRILKTTVLVAHIHAFT